MLVIVDSNPPEREGLECENVSQPRYLAIEATIQLCSSPAEAIVKDFAPALDK
jgi:hypothetical protein